MSTRRLFASLVIAIAFTFTLALWAQEAPPRNPDPAPPTEAPPVVASPAAPVVDEAAVANPAEPPLRDLTAPAVEAGPEADAAKPTTAPASAPNAVPGPGAKPAVRSTPRKPSIPRSGDAMVVFNRDATLEAHGHRDAVVAIGGSSTTWGDVADSVVSILGDSRVEGRVGDVVVSILGNTTVNGEAETVVAVLGGVVLGPNAVVHDVVSVGGPIRRSPGAKVTGESQEIGFLADLPDFTGFRSWIRNALFWGRPLAIANNLGWAWGIASVFFLLYLLMAALFPKAVDRCTQTLETRPGRTIVASIICMVLTPIFMILLAVTVVGPMLAGVVLTVATFIGKAALLAWLGRRLLFGARDDSRSQTVLAVAIGGVLLTALYLIPFLGLALWKVSGVMALGLAVYTLILSSRRPRPAPVTGGAAAVAAAGAMRMSSGPAPVSSAFTSPLSPEPLAGTTSAGFVSGTRMDEPAMSPAPSESTGPVASDPLAASASQAQTFGSFNPGTAAVPLSSLPRAGFWIRIGALAIDIVVVGAASSVVSLGSLFLLLLATYGAVMWTLKGTTIGGIVCGLRVIRLDERPVDWTTSIVRALASFLSLFAGGLGFIWIAVDRDRQSWHDKIAGTAVVLLPQGTPLV
jgi:uncharacterized RDD family membrane protein YckC